MKINKHVMSLKYLQLHTNDIAFGIMSELIFFFNFSTDQSVTNPPNLDLLKPSTHLQLL